MLRLFRLCFGTHVRLIRAQRSLLLENLALRQQLSALKRRHPRPTLGTFDRLFWVVARQVWSGWKECLVIVAPETVARWHRWESMAERGSRALDRKLPARHARSRNCTQ